MRTLPASVLRGLDKKQIAALGAHVKVSRPRTKPKRNLHTPRLLAEHERVTVTTNPTVITLRIGGVPENLANSRYGKAVHAKHSTNPWSHMVGSLAGEALVVAHLPHQTLKHPKRRVEFMIFRCAPMFDPDGATMAMKPILDALKGVLIYDDSPTYIKEVVDQTQIHVRADQHIEITVRDLPEPS
jgi:hypothetical protein